MWGYPKLARAILRERELLELYGGKQAGTGRLNDGNQSKCGLGLRCMREIKRVVAGANPLLMGIAEDRVNENRRECNRFHYRRLRHNLCLKKGPPSITPSTTDSETNYGIIISQSLS